MDKIIILDFGGQYNLLIARRVREAGVYCEVLPFTAPVAVLSDPDVRGVILTGGPASVTGDDSPRCDARVFESGLPVLGICYGAQLMAQTLGGAVCAGESGEYGPKSVTFTGASPLFAGLEGESVCWMSHRDRVTALPEGFRVTAATDTCPFAAFEREGSRLYGVQFHPEVEHTERGREVLRNFLFNICACAGDWKMSAFVGQAVEKIRGQAGGGRVLCALSGGVDSAVCAALTARAVGDRLTCIFVDHGLMRLDEGRSVERVFRDQFNIDLVAVDASERFLGALAGVTEPERKRRIIGEEFIRVFEAEARRLGRMDWLAQGTIYPDVIESGAGDSETIKSHHNVGGLPADMGFRGIIEPLRMLFKDEVRAVGAELGLPEALINRQPFPGPGLGVRIIGEVTREKADLLRRADSIFREELEAAGLGSEVSQYFAVLTDLKSVGVMGDGRTYDRMVALRAVRTGDFMTADWYPLPHELLARVSSRIVNETRGVNRVVYDITDKPPGTIEWE